MHRWAPQLAIGALVERFGGSVSHVLHDPRCQRFAAAGIEGVVPYRRGFRCLVAIGDPVCDGRDAPELAERFRRFCAAQGRRTVVAAASERFAASCVERGYAAVEFGEELSLDPARDPRTGSRGRELRKKLYRAERAGVTASEYRPLDDDPALEAELKAVALAWLSGRRGPQVYITPLELFPSRVGRRWFYARHGAAPVGALSLQRIAAREGWVFEHLVAVPDAPQGTTEHLVTTALEALGREGCRYATFGPSTLARLGRIERLDWYSEAVGRAVFSGVGRAFGLCSLAHFRRKFQAVSAEGSFLLFHPARIGLFQATGLLSAFNVSLR
jgi:lysylphosphatidylglycerol synthetase-like protein (DUF2156 family)